MVQQAIQERAVERVVADKFASFAEPLVTPQNDLSAPVPLADEAEGGACSFMIERLVGDLVDEEQFYSIGRKPYEMQARTQA